MAHRRRIFSKDRVVIKKPLSFVWKTSKRKRKPFQTVNPCKKTPKRQKNLNTSEQTRPRCCVPECRAPCLLFRFDPTAWGDTALSRRRTRRWITALQVAPCRTREVWVCRRHFKSGRPSQLEDYIHIDWVPSRNLNSLPANPCQECAVLLTRIPSGDPMPPPDDDEVIEVVEISDEEEEDAEKLELVATAMRLVIEDMEREAMIGEAMQSVRDGLTSAQPVPDTEDMELDAMIQEAVKSLRDELESEPEVKVSRKRRRRNSQE